MKTLKTKKKNISITNTLDVVPGISQGASMSSRSTYLKLFREIGTFSISIATTAPAAVRKTNGGEGVFWTGELKSYGKVLEA